MDCSRRSDHRRSVLAPSHPWPIHSAASLIAAWDERDRRYSLGRRTQMSPEDRGMIADWRRVEIDHLPPAERRFAWLACITPAPTAETAVVPGLRRWQT